MYVDIVYIKTYYPLILVRDWLVLAVVCVLLYDAARKDAFAESSGIT